MDWFKDKIKAATPLGGAAFVLTALAVFAFNVIYEGNVAITPGIVLLFAMASVVITKLGQLIWQAARGKNGEAGPSDDEPG